jgi:hypothetical protein
MCPRNQLTGAGRDGITFRTWKGVLPKTEIQAVIDNVSQRSFDPILRRSGRFQRAQRGRDLPKLTTYLRRAQAQ